MNKVDLNKRVQVDDWSSVVIFSSGGEIGTRSKTMTVNVSPGCPLHLVRHLHCSSCFALVFLEW